MTLLWNGVSAIARVAAWCGGAMLCLAAFVVTFEVLIRKALPLVIGTFAAPDILSSSNEISGFLFAVGTSWSMAYVLVTRGHVRIDALYGGLAPRTRAILDLLAMTALGLFVAVVLERAFDVAWTSYTEGIRSNSKLRPLLAIPQLPWFAGFALFFVAIVVGFLRGLIALLAGDYATVGATIGAPSQDEEIEGEIKGLGLGGDARGHGFTKTGGA